MVLCLLVSADIHPFLLEIEDANKERKLLDHTRIFNCFFFCLETQTSGVGYIASLCHNHLKLIRFKLIYTEKPALDSTLK